MQRVQDITAVVRSIWHRSPSLATTHRRLVKTRACLVRGVAFDVLAITLFPLPVTLGRRLQRCASSALAYGSFGSR